MTPDAWIAVGTSGFVAAFFVAPIYFIFKFPVHKNKYKLGKLLKQFNAEGGQDSYIIRILPHEEHGKRWYRWKVIKREITDGYEIEESILKNDYDLGLETVYENIERYLRRQFPQNESTPVYKEIEFSR